MGEIGHFYAVSVGAETVVMLHGEHDLSTAPALREILQQLVDQGRNVVVDVANAEFLDCSIVHALFDADTALRSHGRRLALRIGTTGTARRILEIAGVLDRLTAAAREEAVTLVRDELVAGRLRILRSHGQESKAAAFGRLLCRRDLSVGSRSIVRNR